MFKNYGVMEWVKNENGVWKGTVVETGQSFFAAKITCLNTNRFVKKLGIGYIKYTVAKMVSD